MVRDTGSHSHSAGKPCLPMLERERERERATDGGVGVGNSRLQEDSMSILSESRTMGHCCVHQLPGSKEERKAAGLRGW